MLTHDILTKMSADESLKAKVEETKRILQDPIYFIETYIKITDAETGRQIPFLLYKYQRRAIKKYMKRKRCLTMKSRQTGLTTVTQAFMAWVMVTKDNQICKCISNRMKISVKFLQGVRQMLDGAKMATGKLIITGQGKRKYKSWIIPEYSVSLNAKEAFALENNSTIIAEGNTPEAGRGDTINWLVIDEVAAIDYQKKSAMEDIWASAGPALTRSGGTCIAISCVTKDSYVFTDKGIEQIGDFIPKNIIDTSYKQDLEIDNYNILGKDKKRQSNLFCINGIGKTRKIKTRFSELEGSYKHKGWVYSDNEYKIQTFENLKVGDWVNVQYKMNCWGNNDIVSDFKPSEAHKFSSNMKKILFPKLLTKDWCYLFGLYLSEGCGAFVYNKEGIRIGGSMTITCGDNITKVFNNLGIKWSTYDNMHYQIGSKNLLEFFEYIGFDLKRKAHNKEIPKRLMSISRDNMASLLQGIFDGDGCSGKTGRVTLVSSSKKMIEQVRIILLNFGCLSYQHIMPVERANQYHEKSGFNKSNYDSHTLELTTNSSYIYHNEIGFRLERKASRKFIPKYTMSELPDSKNILNRICKLAGKNYSIDSLKNKHGIKVTYKKNYSRENIERVLDFLLKEKPELFFNKEIQFIQDRILIPNSVWVPIKEIEELNNETFDVSLPQTEDFWCHSVLYNGILMEQTPKGKRGWYFDQYVDAESKGWDIIEAPWVENPIYNLGMYRWVKSTAEGAGEDEGSLEVLNDSWPDTSHPDNLAKYKTKETYEYIKDGKIRSPWYDVESRSLGTNRTACELDCSFSGSGGECLESEVINNHKLLCMEPVRKGLLGFMKSYFTFKEYVKGREYLIIVDIATGDGSDSSTVIVIDIADLEVVATFKDDKITPDNLAFVVYDVAKEYGKPTVVIENNGPGLTCLLKLQNDLNYDNTKIYRSKLKKKDPNERDGKKSKLGFWQSNETRSLGGNTLEEWLNTYKIKINDKRIQKELETWVWKDGRRDHLPDKHDDLIMALTMCAYILRYVYGRYAKMKDKKESGALTVQRQRIGLQRTVVYNKFDNGLDEEGFST